MVSHLSAIRNITQVKFSRMTAKLPRGTGNRVRVGVWVIHCPQSHIALWICVVFSALALRETRWRRRKTTATRNSSSRGLVHDWRRPVRRIRRGADHEPAPGELKFRITVVFGRRHNILLSADFPQQLCLMSPNASVRFAHPGVHKCPSRPSFVGGTGLGCGRREEATLNKSVSLCSTGTTCASS